SRSRRSRGRRSRARRSRERQSRAYTSKGRTSRGMPSTIRKPRRGVGGEGVSEAAPNFEGLLREALAPVEPPEDLTERLESTLTSITEVAAEELHDWELWAMRAPRNWVRPAAALMAGTAAGAVLVLVRARVRARGEVSRGGLAGARDTAESTIRDLARQT